mgnify:CR=1 FL=1
MYQWGRFESQGLYPSLEHYIDDYIKENEEEGYKMNSISRLIDIFA